MPVYSKNVLNSVAFHCFTTSNPLTVRTISRGISHFRSFSDIAIAVFDGHFVSALRNVLSVKMRWK